MRELFEQNASIILFAHGLVFFSLGFAVWLQRRRASRLVLSSSLIWLAAFAFVESLAVWGHVFVPIQQEYLPGDAIAFLVVLRALLQVAAFVFLVEFGLRLIDLRPALRRALSTGAAAAGTALLVGGAVVADPAGWSVLQWEDSVVAVARYGLLLPGAGLAAVGLWRQRGELGDAGMTAIKPYAAAAAGVLVLYAVFAGLVVDAAPWAPAGVASDAGWFASTGVPIAVVRGLAGLALCVAAVKLLEIFDVEAKQRLDATERARAVAEERARFRRDLHDGTIQSIYAAGLHLEAVAIRSEDPALRGQVRGVVGDLNQVTDGIRDYIRALAHLPATPEMLASGLSELTRRFSRETGHDARFRAEGVGACGPLPEEIGQHLEQILREALANSARHAGGSRVDVRLALGPDELELSVCDDGRGIAAARGGAGPDGHGHGHGHGHGLRNMHERARRLGGRLAVSGDGGGTRVLLSIPLDADVPEEEPVEPAAWAPAARLS